MINYFSCLKALIVFLLLPPLIHAGVPDYINYQGRLTDGDGEPISGIISLKFTIYGSSLGDDLLWSSGFQTVQVDDGFFSYELGSHVSLFWDLFSDDPSLYLGITVESESEIQPRTRLLSVPFAYHSYVADSAEVAPNPPDDDWVISGEDIYHMEGKVGIGTPNPACNLHIHGGDNGNPKIILNSTNYRSMLQFYHEDNPRWDIMYHDTNKGLWFWDNSIPVGISHVVMHFEDSTGRIGIGTTEPLYRLDVNGDTKVRDNLFIDDLVGVGTTSPGAEMHVNGAIRLGAGNREFEIFEVDADASTGWSQYIDYDGIAIGSHDGNNRQMFMFTDGATTQNIFTIATSQNNGSTWEADFAIQQDGKVGIGISNPSEELHVVGDICYTGSIGACSDARYKKEVTTLSGALDKVSKLRGVSFNWRRDKFPENKFSDEDQVGLIAQEVNEVFPQIVTQTDKGYYNIDYARLTPLLVEAIKELKVQNEELKASNEVLLQRIEKIENGR